jgi:hypothetical protein
MAADGEARGCLVCNSVGELVGVDEELGPVLLHAMQDRAQVFERALEQAVEQDELALPDSVSASAHSLLAFLLGINLLSKSLHDEQALWATCRAFLTGFGVAVSVLDLLD